MTELTIYDLSLGERRLATQEDVDQLQRFVETIATIANHIEDKRELTHHFDFKLKIFPNRMRTDGVFVAQDLIIEPYPHVKTPDGKPCYPSIPQNGYHLKSQLGHAFAAEIVKRWNRE